MTVSPRWYIAKTSVLLWSYVHYYQAHEACPGNIPPVPDPAKGRDSWLFILALCKIHEAFTICSFVAGALRKMDSGNTPGY